jgi:hypothetical protein
VGLQFVAHADFLPIPFRGYCGETHPTRMKKVYLLAAILIALLSSCMSVRQIGQFNMISTRNIDSKTTYVLLKTYAGGDKKELKKARAETIDQAIDKTVKSVPGGEYMMNVKIYIITKGDAMYFAAEGDVWGRGTTAASGEVVAASYKGFKVGDTVTWKNPKKIRAANDPDYLTGKITSLKGETSCMVKCNETSETKELLYTDLAKVVAVSVTDSGWRVDDKVTWKNPKLVKNNTDTDYLTGVVISVKDANQSCLVKCTETGQTVEVAFTKLSRIK